MKVLEPWIPIVTEIKIIQNKVTYQFDIVRVFSRCRIERFNGLCNSQKDNYAPNWYSIVGIL